MSRTNRAPMITNSNHAYLVKKLGCEVQEEVNIKV
jgi:hypothetical protein